MTTVNPRHTAATAAPLIAANGGATVSAVAGVLPPTSGYAVSVKGYEEDFLHTTPHPIADHLAIAGYVARHRAILAQPGHYLGAWVENGYLVLDVTRVFPERAQAEAAGVQHDQRAIFALGTGTELFRHGNGYYTAQEVDALHVGPDQHAPV